MDSQPTTAHVAGTLGAVEPGLCACGCGQPTELAPYSWRGCGWVKGQPKQYVRYHHLRGNQNGRRKGPDYWVEDRGYLTPCWVWQGHVNASGYGVVNDGGQTRLAYAVYHDRVKTAPGEGEQRDHLCRVRACVNPDHIEVVPAAVNVQRGRLAKVTADQVREMRRLNLRTPEIQLRYGLSRTQAKTIRAGRQWKGVA